MPSIISKVTQLDKDMRLKVKTLEDERAALPEFLREQRKQLSDKYSTDAKKQISAKKQEIEKGLEDAKNSAEEKLSGMLTQLNEYYEKNKDSWIEELYNQCVKKYLGE
jgi:F0F1-type ATP synthase membrane subunit b/b'